MGSRDSFHTDEMGAHARLYEKIAHSPAWLALGFSSRALYVQLRVKLKQTNNGNIEATLATLKHAGFKSSSTLAKALRELETVGLMAKTRQGGIAAGGKLCSLFRFTDKPVYELQKQGINAMKATQDWQRWTALKEAAAAIREAHKIAKRPKVQIFDSKAQELKRISSKSEAVPGLIDSEPGQVAGAPLRISKVRRPRVQAPSR